MYYPAFNIVGATTNAAAQGNPTPVQGDGNSMPFAMILILNITTLTGTAPTLQLILEAFDDLSGQFIQWGASASFPAVNGGTTVIVVGSTGLGAGPQGGVTQTVNLPVPSKWRLRMVAGGTITLATYTVSVYTIPLIN